MPVGRTVGAIPAAAVLSLKRRKVDMAVPAIVVGVLVAMKVRFFLGEV
jgi:hypothetical protein